MNIRRCILPILLFFAFAGTALAQTVRWEPARGTLPFNQTSELQLIFEGCEPADDPATPAVPGLQLQAVGRSSNMSIINGRVSQTVALTFHVRASQRSTMTIPSFTVNTNKGRITVEAATYAVGDATVGNSSVSLDHVANSKVDVPAQVWAGQVFPVDYTLDVARRYFHSPGSNAPEWNPAPLAVEEWGKPEVVESVAAGEQRVGIVYRARGYAKEPGDLVLNSASQLVNLTTGSPGFGFFSRPNLEQYAITSPRPQLTVRPLPPGAPASFSGAVGNFTLESKVVPTAAAVGEPITWTLTLAGAGNWPEIAGLPQREVSRDFRVVQPQARRTMKEGSLFDGTLAEDVVLIPSQPGQYEIGPVTWSYFDPESGSYSTISTEKVTVNITAPAAQPLPAGTARSNENPGTPPEQQPQGGTERRSITPESPTQAIPRDPLPGGGDAHAPWPLKTVLWSLAFPVPLLLGLWLWLAWRRAQDTDPSRVQREAEQRLGRTIEAIRTATDRSERRVRLQEWQRDAAILWQIGTAVPAPRVFLPGQGAAAEPAKSWALLWQEADRFLYAREYTLPSDWPSRAEGALAAKPAPRFAVGQLFKPRNLLPFAALVCAVFLNTPGLLAEEPGAAYGRGDFAAAEAGWRKGVAANGTDWIARHNLALALAQQSRWGEAAAHATAAFVQHPRDESVRWHLDYLLSRGGNTPEALSGFVRGTPAHTLAQLASPAEWQRVLLGSAALAGIGAAFLLLRSYGRLGRWAGFLGAFILLGALFGGIAGTAGSTLYSTMGNARAAMVWKPSVLRSVPTEADTQQKTTPIAAGTLAVVDKVFLGWHRLSFENGQTGWIRSEELVFLWK